MGCGCNQASAPIVTKGARLEGDVVAEALYPMTWAQNVGGRHYHAPMPSTRMWVNREHVKAHPKLWQLIADPEAETPDIESIRAMGLEAMGESA